MLRCLCLALVLVSSRARAAEAVAPARVPAPPSASGATPGTDFKPEFVLESARVLEPEPDPEMLQIRVNGEYQLRATALTNLKLSSATDSLGQRERLYHWLRITPRLQAGERLQVVAQADVPEGMIIGKELRTLSPGFSPYDARQPVLIEPRWLYADLRFSFGRLRVGQAPFHSGLGMVENDGDHPSLFGDYERGSKFLRVEFLSGSARSRFRVLAAGDLVYEDLHARLADGDMAARGTLGFEVQDARKSSVGLVVIARHQRGSEQTGLSTTENSVLLDSFGGFSARIPGATGFVFGGYEAAYRIGDRNFIRALSGTVVEPETDVRAFGAVAELGAVLTSGTAEARWGSAVFSVAWGYASGDDDPLDGTLEAFRFDANENVGLIIFDEVLRCKTARSAALLGDPRLAPGADPLPSGGAVFGATYVNPSVVLRPVRELDLKFSAVLAQTTSDLVDPARLIQDGRYRNYDNGDPGAHDLGLELDSGIEYRVALERPMTLELGAQGGVFFPGNAFADARGRRLDTQAQAIGRLGLQY